MVSAYNDSLAPGPRFSKHLADSANASSAVQLLLMITPDQEPVVTFSRCQAAAHTAMPSSSATNRIENLAIGDSSLPGRSAPAKIASRSEPGFGHPFRKNNAFSILAP